MKIYTYCIYKLQFSEIVTGFTFIKLF